MLRSIIQASLKQKALVLLFVSGIIGFGLYSLLNIPIGAVPDVTNNQVQVITTSRDLSTQEVERLLTYPVELAMANLPGVEEIRSVSKFGLSVVTVVFEDAMGTFLPRQLINEKLGDIASQMPEGHNPPFMGPISTGLGEIYQYILDVKPGYQDKYTVSELRTIQDWIVKRQLAGIPGVVEVNTWGGFLKTYEVAVNPDLLKSMNISLDQVYQALQNNNSVVGGGYIEKSEEAFFIRADGLAKSLEDLENIIVVVKESIPIYVKDIANVQYGSATRFGAITGNGEGEKVLGQVMMLKDADSKKVITAVVDRVDEIQKSLPEGVFINPFLSRTELIGRTTFTIAENLILGFLIVLFVVVFLLGNWRSGLLVASVIPLTLLFALSLMYVFGIDANLLSLGAIDFGIIIDGAVIIVEYLTYLFASKSQEFIGLTTAQRREKKDGLVLRGANKMMHSAVFGQLIIIIVFLPILTLAGVEGKMFKPMALTFCFALLGAMILCFTYVPVMASLFLKSEKHKTGIGDRFINFVKRLYKPSLEMAIRLRWIVIALVVFFFVGTLAIFNRMGGEFIPTLDEGDFVIQPVLKTGMSLASTVQMTTRIEKILKRFPEVKQVVSRIGAAEVPTDPMSMEESDVIITLTDKKTWTSAVSKDELANVFKQAINDEIPNVEIEFTQPIEMRFNELISGARSDLAIKLFGEDLDILYKKAEEIQKLVEQIEGAADISVEKIDGLPQMIIDYDRQRMARYGVSLSELNDVVQVGFAGKVAGVLHEGEKQFDIILKYDKMHRSDIEDIRNAQVSLPNGQQLPLSTFADIRYDQGPAKISRDDTKRRVVVGVNIRGRDLQSVVEDTKRIIDQELQIPTGYYIQYGGQFKNLEQATSRLLVAVPIALVLIFMLLYFAFQSFKETLLIYSAIPLSAIGGVLALYIRDLPFSISAGVGFIALFGIAVLNGIVLIEHFNELKTNKMNDSYDYIVQGALDRIRPVLLTAFAAALGFLPMAISTSAGAEIQRPLATVVIGGLVSATLLTLIILPILYIIFIKDNTRSPKTSALILLPFLLLLGQSSSAQEIINVEQAKSYALQNNHEILLSDKAIEREKAMIDAVQTVENYDFYYSFDKNNITESGQALHVLGMGHAFKLPGVNKSKKEAQKAQVAVSALSKDVTTYMIEYEIVSLYDKIQYEYQKVAVLAEIDSVYSRFVDGVERKNTLGESNRLEVLAANQRKGQTALDYAAAQRNLKMSLARLNTLMRMEGVEVKMEPYKRRMSINKQPDNPVLAYRKELVTLNEKKAIADQKEKLPLLNLGLFNGFDPQNDFQFYPGVEAGIAIPLARNQYRAKQQANQLQTEWLQINADKYTYELNQKADLLTSNAKRLDETLTVYESALLDNAEELIRSAEKSWSLGQIDYLEYLMMVGQALDTRLGYLDLLHQYNQIILSNNYLK